MMRQFTMIALGLWIALPAMAQTPAKPDCASLNSVNRQKTYEADPQLIEDCINQKGETAWEPPVSWRLNEGKSVRSGRGGFSINARQAPEHTPAVRGAPASVSSSMFNFSIKFPPYKGFPCQLPGGVDLCGSGTSGTTTTPPTTTVDPITGSQPGGGTSPSCAIASDTGETYGEKQPLTAGAQTLSCGGAMPLSTYRMVLNPNATNVFITNAGTYNAWAFRNNGSSYAASYSGTLPTYLCSSPTASKTYNQGQVPLRPPVAQIITYSNAASYITLRLQPEDASDVPDPFDPPEVADPGDEPIEPEKYLIVPIVNGVPRMPTDCAQVANYYRAQPPTNDAIIVESSTQSGCEGALLCSGSSTLPTTPNNCDTATLTPTIPNSTSCDDKLQIAVLDRPNLILAAPATATSVPISGSPISMIASAAASRLYLPSDTYVYLGTTGSSYNLPEGATVKLDTYDQLRMNGPAIINGNTRSATLTNGGSVQSSSGVLVREIAAGNSTGIQAAAPLVMRVNRVLELPSGYILPTQPNGYVRLPVTAE